MSNYTLHYDGRHGITGNVFEDGRTFETHQDAYAVLWDLHTSGDDIVVWPLAIDPLNCACTECLTGEYVSLGSASSQHVADMLDGRILNNTGDDPQVKTIVTLGGRTFEVEQ